MATDIQAAVEWSSGWGSTDTHFDCLPVDVMYHMLSFLPIDNRHRVKPLFACSHLGEAFDQRERVLSSRRAIGLERLDLPLEALASRPDLRQLIVEYNLHLPFLCSAEIHVETDRFSCNQELAKAIDPNATGGSLLTRTPDLESLDLRGVLLTVPLLTLLIDACPKLCCLRLNFASFECAEAYDLFLKRLAPRLRHLSLDNLFIEGLELIFHAAVRLEEVQVVLGPMPNTSPKIFSTFTSQRLSLFSLKLFRTSRRHALPHPPAAFIAALHQSPAKEVVHFRIKSNYDHLCNYDLLNEAKKLSNLRSVNLDLMNYYHLPDSNYNFSGCWPKLKLLNCDFYGLRGSNLLLLSFLNGPFHSSLECLTIHDCRLLKSTMKEIAWLCPNLKMITLNDVTVKHLKWLFDWLAKFPKLNTLKIKFALKEWSGLNGPNVRQVETVLHFPEEKISLLRDFLEKHPSLTSVFIDEWPGLKKATLNKALEGLCAMRNIILNFREY